MHPQILTSAQFTRCRNEIAALPDELESLLQTLAPHQLAQPYRPRGWTGLQVVHHLADSHMHALLRVKWALAENNPTIMGYDQDAWAALPGANDPDLHLSLAVIKAVHAKWVHQLDAMNPTDRARSYYHQGYKETRSLDFTMSLYAWHGKHHLGHLQLLAAAAVH